MRRGRRTALELGYLIASLGCALGIWAVQRDNVLALAAALLLIGLGNAGAQLSRYAAADLYPSRRRGAAIGLLVWAAAIGAVGGPLLLAWSGSLAGRAGLLVLSGPFILGGVACLAAIVAITGYHNAPAPPPAAPAHPGPPAPPVHPGPPAALPHTTTPSAGRPLLALLGTPLARSSLATMVTAQVVMVAVMTATPMDMRMHGAGLGLVGMALSAHTLGMFALSPVTGRFCDRFGARPVMAGGLCALVASTGLVAMGGGAAMRAVALFLLGYAWNLCFLGGSSQLATNVPDAERIDVEGAVDGAVWTTAAIASLASTAIMSATGYPALAMAACGFAGLITIGGRWHPRSHLPDAQCTSRAPAPRHVPACAPECGGGGEESGSHAIAGGGAGARGSRRPGRQKVGNAAHGPPRVIG
jgi:MFS family permease